MSQYYCCLSLVYYIYWPKFQIFFITAKSTRRLHRIQQQDFTYNFTVLGMFE